MSGVQRVPKTIRLLAEHGAKAFAPSIEKKLYNTFSLHISFEWLMLLMNSSSYVSYKGPLVGKRAAAHMRKRSVIDGSYGSFHPTKGIICLVYRR